MNMIENAETNCEKKPMSRAMIVQNTSTRLLAFVWFPGFIILGFAYYYIFNEPTWLALTMLEWMALGCATLGILASTQTVVAVRTRRFEGLVLFVPMAIMGFVASGILTKSVLKQITEPPGGAYVSPAAVETSAHP
jgi:uncharacterized membrane protein HdeD (DUF308 family)